MLKPIELLTTDKDRPVRELRVGQVGSSERPDLGGDPLPVQV